MHLGGAVKAVMGAQNMGMGMGMQQPAMVPGMGTMGGVMPMAGQVRLGNPPRPIFSSGLKVAGLWLQPMMAGMPMQQPAMPGMQAVGMQPMAMQPGMVAGAGVMPMGNQFV